MGHHTDPAQAEGADDDSVRAQGLGQGRRVGGLKRLSASSGASNERSSVLYVDWGIRRKIPAGVIIELVAFAVIMLRFSFGTSSHAGMRTHGTTRTLPVSRM